MKVYYLRYLLPRGVGFGVLLSAIAAEEGFTLADWKEKEPDKFKRSGFYTLMTWSDDQLTVQ
jgi:hypothetical protein